MSELERELVPLRECLDDALTFRNVNRGEPRAAEYLKWRYLARPCAIAPHVVWLNAAGRRVAAATVAPHDFAFRGDIAPLGIVGDVSVASSERGRGTAGLLLQHVSAASRSLVPGCIVLPNDAFERTLRRSAWKELGALQRGTRVLRASPSAPGPASLARRAIKHALARALRVVDAVQRRSIRGPIELAPATAGDSGVAELWQRVRAGPHLLAARSAQYLEWRYVRHPIHRYELLALRRGAETAGYTVLRTDGRIVWIEDAIAVDEASAAALALELIARAAATTDVVELHARYSSTWLPGVPWQRFGFVRRPDRQPIFGVGAASTSDPGADLTHAALYAAGGDKDV
jgi:hypothetical protein